MQNLQQQNTLRSERMKRRSTQKPTATMKRNVCEKVVDESKKARESGERIANVSGAWTVKQNCIYGEPVLTIYSQF